MNDRETGLEGNTRGPSVSGPADFLRRHGTVLLFVGIYFAIGAWTLTGMHDWGGDFSLYIAEARAIAENGTIVEPDYVHLGRLSPVTYPPGLPLLLAPVYAMFGLDFQMLKLPPFASLCLGLLAIYAVLYRTHSRGIALATVLLFALDPYVWLFRQNVLSEFPYVMFAFIALFFNGVATSGRTGRDLVISIVTGLAIMAAYKTREVGLVLLFAVALHRLINCSGRRDVAGILVLLAAFYVPVFLYKRLVVSPGYIFPNGPFCFSCVDDRLYGYYTSILGAFTGIGYGPSPYGIADLLTAAAVLFTAAGLMTAVAGRYDAHQREGPRWLRFLRSFSAMDLYFGGMLLLLHIVRLPPSSRMLLPLVPIAICYMLVATRAAFMAFPEFRRTWPLVVALPLAAFLALDFRNCFRPDPDELRGAVTPQTMKLYEYIRNNVTDDDLVLVGRPRVFALFTRRPSTYWSTGFYPGTVADETEERGITYMVLGKTASGLPTYSWMFWNPTINRTFKIVYEDDYFRVLKRRQ